MKPFALLTLILLLLGSCSKEEAPPISQENSFSCRVNGKLFIPKTLYSFPTHSPGIITRVWESKDWTFILGNEVGNLRLYLADVSSNGTYTLGLSDGDADFFEETENAAEYDNKPRESGTTHISTEKSGTLEVLELEMGERIVLQFDKLVLKSKDDPNKTLVLTEGKLNINLKTLNQ